MQRVVSASVVRISINDKRSQSFCTENVSVLKSDVFVLVVLGFAMRKKKREKKKCLFSSQRFCSRSFWFRSAQKMFLFSSQKFLF